MQALELHMLGMQPLQVDAGFGCIGDLGQHRLRIAQARRHAVELAELDRNGPAAAGVARIFQNSEIKLDLVQGLVIDRVGKVAGRRQLEVRTRKPPVVGAQHLVDGGDCASLEKPMSVIQIGSLRAA